MSSCLSDSSSHLVGKEILNVSMMPKVWKHLWKEKDKKSDSPHRLPLASALMLFGISRNLANSMMSYPMIVTNACAFSKYKVAFHNALLSSRQTIRPMGLG
jgi:hypothetical protein